MERPRKQTIACRGGCESARELRAVWEGDRREAKVSTGLGKAHRPGSQGGLRKRGPWWNEAPTSRIERARVGNSPPKVVRAAVLSRPLRAKDKLPRHQRWNDNGMTGTVQDRESPRQRTSKPGEPQTETVQDKGRRRSRPSQPTSPYGSYPLPASWLLGGC